MEIATLALQLEESYPESFPRSDFDRALWAYRWAKRNNLYVKEETLCTYLYITDPKRYNEIKYQLFIEINFELVLFLFGVLVGLIIPYIPRY